MNESSQRVPDDTPVHRIGGGGVESLALKPGEAALSPPGISVLRGGTPAEAAEAMRDRFPRMAPRGKTTVGTTTGGRVRQAGFDVIPVPTPRFPHHGRLIHSDGEAGFERENLERLAEAFDDQPGL